MNYLTLRKPAWESKDVQGHLQQVGWIHYTFDFRDIVRTQYRGLVVQCVVWVPWSGIYLRHFSKLLLNIIFPMMSQTLMSHALTRLGGTQNCRRYTLWHYGDPKRAERVITIY